MVTCLTTLCNGKDDQCLPPSLCKLGIDTATSRVVPKLLSDYINVRIIQRLNEIAIIYGFGFFVLEVFKKNCIIVFQDLGEIIAYLITSTLHCILLHCIVSYYYLSYCIVLHCFKTCYVIFIRPRYRGLDAPRTILLDPLLLCHFICYVECYAILCYVMFINHVMSYHYDDIQSSLLVDILQL